MKSARSPHTEKEFNWHLGYHHDWSSEANGKNTPEGGENRRVSEEMHRTKARRRSIHAAGTETSQQELTDLHGALRAKVDDKFKVNFPDEVNELDLGTDDEWIHRDPSLIRLTGRLPLNAEPPIDKLMDYGLVTPAPLFFVRNHSSVPKLQWETHNVMVDGLVDNPQQFSMDDLAGMPTVRILVTVSCDGNRRRELNTIRKTRGFNFGPGAIGCAYWTGVRLCDVLARCGVKEGARFVWFEGADRLHQDNYGTSIPLSIAMDPGHDIILAQQMNDEKLSPDHGFPVRLIIPGYVGGRMIKWLKSITVSAKETQNFYHWHDNKLLPSSVDSVEAAEEGWWYNSEYTLYEHSINSVITHPIHGENLNPNQLPQEGLTLRGYAYSGGGRKIVRVEYSVDEGQSWHLCDRHYPHEAVLHNKYWTWCHWTAAVDTWRLTRARSIIVRAWDSSMNSQPPILNWNMLGVMNNGWYKLTVEMSTTPNEPALVFQHPVVPGSAAQGWMVKDQLLSRYLELQPSSKGEEYTTDEVARHNTANNCWVIIRNMVFDLTNFLREHPGGAPTLLAHAGSDATEVFEAAHAEDSFRWRDAYFIGYIRRDCAEVLGAEPVPPVVPSRELQTIAYQGVPGAVLSPRKWLQIVLKERTPITKDTLLLTFQRTDPQKPFGLPIGHHIYIADTIGGSHVSRPYTPILPVSLEEDKGTFTLLIKVYRPHNNIPGGVMTQHLEKLQPGAQLQMRGPNGHIIYRGCGRLTLHGTHDVIAKRISMIGGGTGITPLYQVIKAVTSNPHDQTEIRLLYANKTPSDILLREELDQLAKEHPNFSVWYTVDTAGDVKSWPFSVGHVTEDMTRSKLFPPGNETQGSYAMVCGPPPLVEHVCLPSLSEIGFDEDHLLDF